MSRARTRGLTLVELLLTLGLLGSLSLALAAWTTTTSRLAGKITPEVRWRAAAAATLRQIGDDLFSGDIPSGEELRVAVKDGRLTIRTRALQGGPAEHAFVFDPTPRTLDLIEAVFREAREPERAVHRLLRDVSDWEATLDAEKEQLEVVVTGPEGLSAKRAWSLP